MFYEGKNLTITPETKIGELLDTYPGLEEKLIEIAPVFIRLRNPVLRKTIAKVTSIRQAAAVGNVNMYLLLNVLRKATGQEEVEVTFEKILCNCKSNKGVKFDMEYDTRPDLEAGVPPVARVFNDLKLLKDNQVYKIITPFYPAPLISKAKDKGFTSKTFQADSECYETYFRKEQSDGN